MPMLGSSVDLKWQRTFELKEMLEIYKIYGIQWKHCLEGNL